MRTSKAYRLLNRYISIFLTAMLIISSTLISGGRGTFAAEDKKAEQASENNKSGEGERKKKSTPDGFSSMACGTITMMKVLI